MSRSDAGALLVLMGAFVGILSGPLLCAYFGITSMLALAIIGPASGAAILFSFYHFVGALHFIAGRLSD